jgi:xanthine dehydrogenase YagS FAD-binding subunit
MRPFLYQRADNIAEAIQAASTYGSDSPPTMVTAQFLAGGTRPERLVDINEIERSDTRIEQRDDSMYLGAFVTMAAAADHPDIRQNYPVVAQSLDLAASPQIRNMATLGGNVLQRTRCNYFRDPSWGACNKREPGSGCAALAGVNRKHAILGVSDHCIAAYPGDFAQALVALNASVEIIGPDRLRVIPFEQLHCPPGDTPHIESVLAPGELIVAFRLPVAAWTRRSLYLKIRDRQSYEFALASAAVALDLADGRVAEARIALGGVATKPWRAREAEAVLKGRALDETGARRAAEAAFASARTHGGNDYKLELGKRTLVRALLQASQLSV